MLIDLDYLISKYQLKPTGVLHIGASTGQERDSYHKHGLKVVWVEAIREVYKQLCRNVTPYTGTVCINACISDKDGEIVPFNISNNEMQSSSMFDFGTHTIEHPGVVFTHKTQLQTLTVKTILKDRNLEQAEYDFVNLDIQGAELLALKGMDLRWVNYVYIEVNERELYKGCPLLPEIDAYLKKFDLVRVETKMTNNGWGDAFYIKEYRIEENMVQVPLQFRPKHPFAYPGDNDTEFERWYYDHYQPSPMQGRMYLPVMWTAYYCLADKTSQSRSGQLKSLQAFINSLDRSKKYYTIVQYDDGILNDLSGLDIMVFSMSGKPMHYPLPLICKDHAPLKPVEKNIFASFMGRITHPIRKEIMKIRQPGWFITEQVQKLPGFCEVLNRSIFTLCPRGYGPTSFRIKECMQYGSIPVYISDEFIEPHGIPFDSYGVKVKPEDVPNLPQILKQIDIKEKQKAIKMLSEMFTFQGCRDIVDNEVKYEKEYNTTKSL